MRYLAPLLLLLLIASTPIGPESEDAAAQEPDRVIVRANRNLEVAGTVEMEDDEVIVIRDIRRPDAEPLSFVKSRVVRIIRLVDPEPGQRGVVLLRSGQRHEGVIIEDGFEHVVMDIEGIEARLRREVVDFVLLEPTVHDRYVEYKEALKPGMHAQHLVLCHWLVEQKQYELAEGELVELLEDEPDMSDAFQLLKVVRAQRDLERRSAVRHEREADAAGAESSREADVEDELPGHLLSASEVNLVRVYEIDFNRPPKVVVDPETIRELLEQHGTSPLIPASSAARSKIFRADPIDVVRLMFELRARELYPRIRVISEPWSLNQFRQRVHDSWLMNNCATSNCHGGLGAGRLFLHRARAKDARTRYTNLLILERLQIDERWPLINYDEPGMSLIIQHALPRTEAQIPHPDVAGWEPCMKRSGRVIGDTLAWIESMMQPRPDYPVEYEPPVLETVEEGIFGEEEVDRAPR